MFWKAWRDRRLESDRQDAERAFLEADELRKQGHIESAIDRYEASLERFESSDLQTSRAWLRCLRGLGDCRFAQDRFDEAMGHYQRAQSLEEAGSVPSIEGYLATNRIGRCWIQLEDLDKAHESFTRSLAGTIEIHGPRHRDVAMAQSCLGDVLREMELFEQARGKLQECLVLRRELFGEGRETAQSLLDIGKLWQREGRYEQAMKSYQQCLAIRLGLTTRLYGAAHADVSDVYMHIGMLEDERGASTSAVKAFRQSLGIRERIHPKGPRTASALKHLGRALIRGGAVQDQVRTAQRSSDTERGRIIEMRPRVD